MARRARSSDPEDLREAFKRAAEIAQVVPTAMQEAAFHRALDQILGADSAQRGTKAGRSSKREVASEEVSGGNAASRLIDGINRTAHPEVTQANKVLDRALAVLRIASRDFEIDGLTAPEVAKVLTEKFRQRTSRQAVTRALGAAHSMVDTGTRGRVTVYRIMQAGEDYLDSGGGHREQDGNAPTKPTRRPRRKARSSRTAGGEAGTSAAQKKAPRASRRKGPKAALGELIDEGFFGQPKTINAAQEQLRHKKGVRFSLQELSPALVRLLRDGRLDRDRNESGQYEYEAK